MNLDQRYRARLDTILAFLDGALHRAQSEREEVFEDAAEGVDHDLAGLREADAALGLACRVISEGIDRILVGMATEVPGRSQSLWV